MAAKKTAAKSTAAKKKKTTTTTPKKAPASKPSAAKEPVEQTPEQQSSRRQKAAIALMAVAALLIAMALIEGESAWRAVHNFMFGVFGTCTYIWPVMLIYVSVMLAMNKTFGSISSNLIGVGISILLLCSAIHIFSNPSEYFSLMTLGDQIKTAWRDYDTFPSAGALGALVGGLLAKMAGKVGAAIINIILLIVSIMFLTGLTLSRLGTSIAKPIKRMSEDTNERLERGAQRVRDEQERAPSRDKRREKKAEEPYVSPRPFPVPPLPTESAKDELEMLDISKKPTEPEKPKKKEPELPPVKEPDPVPDVPDEDEEEPVIESQPTYRKPPITCLKEPIHDGNDNFSDELKSNAQKLLDTLESFNVHAKITEISRGPSVTRYELQPDAGVRINKITNLADDIALRLAASGIRIEAPIPNKAAIGIEVPNKLRSMVYMREIIETPQFKNAQSKLNVVLGKDIAGNAVCADLAKMPHLLIAGTTGSGKSVCLNTMIVSILYNATPDEVKLLMIDPKQVEFTVYNGIAHLAVPVVSDPRKASGALTWAVNEMENRYKILSEKNVRDIRGYNKLAERDKSLRPMHQIVIFIDELADLMMVAPNEVEDAICRLAQKARAAGMHLVIATQRPSVDVITGIIKANIPSRIALSVSSSVDSRTILDMSGAEKLIGNGDMLFSPIGANKPTRIQGCFISDEEVEDVADFIKHNAEAEYDEGIMDEINRQAAIAGSTKKNSAAGGDDGEEPGDEMFPNAVEVVLDAKMASTTLLQRKLKLGYARAARLMDELESKGIIGPFEGSKPRQVLITKQQWMEKCALSDAPADDET